MKVTIIFLDGALTIAAVMAEPTWFERTFLDLAPIDDIARLHSDGWHCDAMGRPITSRHVVNALDRERRRAEDEQRLATA